MTNIFWNNKEANIINYVLSWCKYYWCAQQFNAINLNLLIKSYGEIKYTYEYRCESLYKMLTNYQIYRILRKLKQSKDIRVNVVSSQTQWIFTLYSLLLI